MITELGNFSIHSYTLHCLGHVSVRAVCAIFYVSNAIGVPPGSLYAAFMLCETAVSAVIAPHLDDLLACYVVHTWKGCWKYVDCRCWLLKKYLEAQAAAEDSNALVLPWAVAEGVRAADGVASSVQSNHPKATKLKCLRKTVPQATGLTLRKWQGIPDLNFNLPLFACRRQVGTAKET